MGVRRRDLVIICCFVSLWFSLHYIISLVRSQRSRLELRLVGDKGNDEGGLDLNVTVSMFSSVTANAGWWRRFEQSAWEPWTLRVYRHLITNETVVVDVGAWIGPTTLYAARLGALRVYAFEPDPDAYEALLANIQANPRLAPSIHAMRRCIMHRSGSYFFRWTKGNSGSAILHTTAHRGTGPGGDAYEDYQEKKRRAETTPYFSLNANEETLLVDCITLDRWFHTHVDLLKIDIEGAEEVLVSHGLVSFSALMRATQPGVAKAPDLWLSVHLPYWQRADSEPFAFALQRIYPHCYLSNDNAMEANKRRVLDFRLLANYTWFAEHCSFCTLLCTERPRSDIDSWFLS